MVSRADPLDRLMEIPIVGAPLAGGPSTPQLAASVSEAGGLGFIAAGYKAAHEIGTEIEAVGPGYSGRLASTFSSRYAWKRTTQRSPIT